MKCGTLRSVPVACLLLAGCGSGNDAGSRDVDERDETASRVFDAYSRESTRAYCERGLDAIESPDVAGDELLLLDAAPQCDLQRLGVRDLPNAQDVRVVSRAAVQAEASFALCACQWLEASNRLLAPGQSEITGDVGANERIFSSAPFVVDGLTVSGGEARFDNRLQAAELRVAGTLRASNEVDVSGDAELGGLDVAGERVDVGGTLTVPPGTELSSVVAAAEIVEGAIDVPAPCDCSRDIDYGALRAAFRDVDGDGEDDYDERLPQNEASYPYPAPPWLLSGLVEDHSVYLGCGRYYFDEVQSAAALQIVAIGEVDVFVDGDVDVAGPLTISSEEGGTLDFYVNGRFIPSNTVDLGNVGAPAAFRLYVADELRSAGPLSLSGALFAPHATVTADNRFENRGAIFAGALDFAAPLSVLDGPRFTSDACLLADSVVADQEAN